MKASDTFRKRPRLCWLFVICIGLAYGCAQVPKMKPAEYAYSPVTAYALSLQGIPYRYGKESPEEGFDCSGFVRHVYLHQGLTLPRTVREMAQRLPTISNDDLRPGDLVFFSIDGKPNAHVGIYIDKYDFIHAPSRRTGRVIVSSLNNRYWRERITSIHRPKNLPSAVQ